MLKTLKRKIALVAVAALGAGALSIVAAPVANAVARNATLDTNAALATVLRAGDLSADPAYTFILSDPDTGAEDDGVVATATGTLAITYNGSSVSTLLAAAVTNGANTASSSIPGISINMEDTLNISTAGAITVDAGGIAAAAATTLATVTADPGTMIAGTYVISLTIDYDGAGAAAALTKSYTIVVGGTPSTITVTGTPTSVITGDTVTATVSLKDAAGLATHLDGTERLAITPSAASVGTSTINLTETQLGQGAGTATFTAVPTAGGSFTISVAPSAGTFGTGVTPPTAGSFAITVTSAASVVETATSIDSTVALESSNAALVAAVTANAGDGTNITVRVPVEQKELSVEAAFPANTTGDARFTVTATTSTTYLKVGDSKISAISGAKASASFNTVSPNVGDSVTIKVQTEDAADMGITFTYTAPVDAKMTITPDAAEIASKTGAALTFSAKLVDQWSRPRVAIPVAWTVSARNSGKNATAATDAAGVSNFTYTDTSTSTTVLTDTVTATATVNDSILVAFSSDVAVGSLTLAVTQPTVPGTTATYATTISAAGATKAAALVDSTPAAADNDTAQEQIQDQITVTGTVKNAAGTVLRGVKVVVTGTDGIFFAASGVLADVDVTTAARVKTVTVYSDATGIVAFQAAYTKSGTATITVDAEGVKQTWDMTVTQAANAVISASAAGSVVTATVTDRWGNPVPGVTVNFTAADGATLGAGASSISGSTNTSGKVSVVASSLTTGKYVITASHTGGDSAAAADTVYGMATGVASATATADVVAGGAVNTATTTAIDAVKSDVKAVSDTVATLSKAVTTIQSSVTELTSSFSAQIKSLSSAIAKISRAIAALSKRIK